MWFMEAARNKGRRAVFLCDRISLVEQTSRRFWEAGIRHGIAQGDNTRLRSDPIQICSAQTIEKRGFWPDLDLLVVDEAHTQRKATLEFIKASDFVTIGLTATPFSKGLGGTYHGVVNACTTSDLLAQGWLAPVKVFAAREIDMTGAKKVGGEWTDREVEKRGTEIVGDIVKEWVEKTNRVLNGPQKTLFFGPTVDFCEEICREFQAAGHDFRVTSYRDSAVKSAEKIEQFRRGDYIGLACVDKLVRGVDVADVMCLISSRPYWGSFISHIQQIGRVMRIAPGKDYALIIDHTGNYRNWYEQMQDFFDNGCQSLSVEENKKRTRPEKEKRQCACPACGYVMIPAVWPCPSCGHVINRRSRVYTKSGTMEEVHGIGKRKRADQALKRGAWKDDQGWTWRQICRVASARHPYDDDRARKLALAQYRNLYGEWPAKKFKRDSGAPDSRVEQAIMYRLKKYWRKQKEAA